MKKIFIISLMIFCSSLISVQGGMTRNPKCEDVQSFKVFQVLDSFVLARACHTIDDTYCLGHVVYFQKEKDKIYYDDQIIKVKKNECAIYIGTYQYQLKSGDYKTVPIVKIIDSHN